MCCLLESARIQEGAESVVTESPIWHFDTEVMAMNGFIKHSNGMLTKLEPGQ